jgi:nitrogen fixation-related uncharacterized protein
MIAVILTILEVVALFILCIALAGFIGKLAGKFFDNDPR